MFNQITIKLKKKFVPLVYLNYINKHIAMKKVLVTGGTGFVGKELTKALINVGYTVSILSRTKIKNTASFFITRGI
jgi:FlaA1/EpsC-like NDP-sugar epimerase